VYSSGPVTALMQKPLAVKNPSSIHSRAVSTSTWAPSPIRKPMSPLTHA
jgi:hypothetical protein